MAYAGLTSPAQADARYAEQSGYDPLQLQAMVAGAVAETVVVSGCAVTAQGTPDTTVAVASGTVLINGVLAQVSAGNVAGFTAPTAGLRRIDLVVVDNTGAKSRLAGTAAASADASHAGPSWPAAFDPTTYAVLAEVTVDATDSTVVAGMIVDKRPLLRKLAHGCRIYNSVNISLASGSFTALTFNTERFDTDNFHSTISNTSRLTVPAGLAGKYFVFAHVQISVSGAGAGRYIEVYLNGVDEIARSNTHTMGGSYNAEPHVSTIWDASPGDFLETRVYQDSGGALNAVASPKYSPEFGMIWLGA